MRATRVIVGMSGGVDSAAAAYLMKAAGYEVIGLTLRHWIGGENRCCEIGEARRTAEFLGIPYYVQSCYGDFQKRVVEPFVRAYAEGRTPNPCVECNRHIKWEKLLEAADRMDAAFVVTGHYASVVRREDGRFAVRRAADAAKDQSYMLYRLTQEQLARTRLPLGALTKAEVWAIAARAGLPAANKKDSQELCFVTEGRYEDFLAEQLCGSMPGEGDFVDESGAVLGRHRGIACYTVGQRRGLGLALGYPAYVKSIDAASGRIVIAGEEALWQRELRCGALHFGGGAGPVPGQPLRALVKIRYRHAGEPARIEAADAEHVRVVFDRPVRAPAPGQSAVFYDGDGCVLGGGIIE